MSEKVIVVVAWHNPEQRAAFQKAWAIDRFAPDVRVLFQCDVNKEGCAVTKNKGIWSALAEKADIVVVLDDDCYPVDDMTMDQFVADHVKKLNEHQELSRFAVVTDPPSRGTPYNLPKKMPVAAVMGFWKGIGDYDACAQLVRGATTPMQFLTQSITNKYFPLSGMNLCFRPKEWLPYCQFINVARFDDIWMGWIWQKEAYRRGCCFRLDGPLVQHARQSNVWKNLRDESKHLEANESIWKDIAEHKSFDYDSLRALLPV